MSVSSTKPVGLSPALTLLMSAATGLAVASNYYAQPLLDAIAHVFRLSVNQAGFIVTAAQLGYVCGLMFLVPLGNRFEHRSLIVIMTLLAAVGMLITASAPSLWLIVAGTAGALSASRAGRLVDKGKARLTTIVGWLGMSSAGGADELARITGVVAQPSSRIIVTRSRLNDTAPQSVDGHVFV